MEEKYTSRRLPHSPNEIRVEFADGRAGNVTKTHRQNGFGPAARRHRRYGYSTVVTCDGRVIDQIFRLTWDEIVDEIRAGNNRKTAIMIPA